MTSAMSVEISVDAILFWRSLGMSDSIQVAVRIRPLSSSELSGKQRATKAIPESNQISISSRGFTFDRIFTEESTQEDVWENTVKPLFDGYVQGYNATILAYGQTGSGKTFSMGTACAPNEPPEVQGIIPRTISAIFRHIDECEGTLNCRVSVSFMEILNENVRDLLNPQSAQQPQIRDGPNGTVKVTGITEEPMQSAYDMITCLERGSQARATASTKMNAVSSRSHAIFTVNFTQSKTVGEVEEEIVSKFNFVDLAGSERLKRTGAVGVRMKEGIDINKGLFALGNVISALGDPARKGCHVPFRDSKITRLLQDSLGGNSRTLMIACISPAESNVEETINTLKYAHRARNIKNKPVVNRDPNVVKLEALYLQLAAVQEELRMYKEAAGGNFPSANSEEVLFLQEKAFVLEGQVCKLQSKVRKLSVQIRAMKESSQAKHAALAALRTRMTQLRPDDQHIFDEPAFTTLWNNNEEEVTKPRQGTSSIPRLKARTECSGPMQAERSREEEERQEMDNKQEEDTDAEVESLIVMQDLKEREHGLNLKRMAEEEEIVGMELSEKESLLAKLEEEQQRALQMHEEYKERVTFMEREIASLIKERDQTLSQPGAEQNDKDNLAKVAEQYRQRLKKLEQKLKEAQRQLKEHTTLRNRLSQDEAQLARLREEVSRAKQLKVAIQKQRKEENEKHRRFMQEQQQAMKQLQKQGRQKELELGKLRRDMEKQKNVMQRKLQEITSLRSQMQYRTTKQNSKRKEADSPASEDLVVASTKRPLCLMKPRNYTQLLQLLDKHDVPVPAKLRAGCNERSAESTEVEKDPVPSPEVEGLKKTVTKLSANLAKLKKDRKTHDQEMKQMRAQAELDKSALAEHIKNQDLQLQEQANLLQQLQIQNEKLKKVSVAEMAQYARAHTERTLHQTLQMAHAAISEGTSKPVPVAVMHRQMMSNPNFKENEPVPLQGYPLSPR
eukprot:g54956.t1